MKRSTYAKSLENTKYRHRVIPNKKKDYELKLNKWKDIEESDNKLEK
tara:strand:+ start:209 stop:349 length:141 start_codon:yes stop_codon:yes gene_type:complete